MNNGKSGLIPTLDANLIAMLMFLGCALFGLLNGFWGWLSLFTLFLTIVLFFLDSNSFVRKCAVQTVVFYIIVLISTLFLHSLFGRIPLIGIVFRVVDWAVRTIVLIFAMISGIQAYSGYRYNLPLLGGFVDKLCSILGVF